MSETGFSFAAPRLSILLESARRFPLATLAALVFASLFVVGVFQSSFDAGEILVFVLPAAFLGLLGVALVGEAQKWSRLLLLGVSVGAVAALVGWLALTDAGDDFSDYILLYCALICFCISAPFVGGARNNALWQFNQRSFYGLALAGVAVLVFLLGAGAITYSVTELFDLRRSEKLFFVLSTIGLSLLWPLYTITFIPRLPMDGDEAPSIPTPLAFVLSYVALPVLLVYALIIGVYSVQLFALGQTPKYSVSWMVMGLSCAGITLHFLLYPLFTCGNSLVRLYGRYFYLVLLPYLGLLFWGLGVRVDTYGLTEMRYLGLLGGVWAAGIALYALIEPVRFKLGVAPASLAILLLAASFGPWGAEALSLRSQQARLEQTLTELGVLRDGRLLEQADLSATPWAVRRTLSSQLDYVYEKPALLPAYLSEIKWAQSEFYPRAEALMRRWNMVYVNRWEQRSDKSQPTRHYNLYSSATFSAQNKALPIDGYDWMMTFYAYRNQSAQTTASPILSAVIRDDKLVLSVAKHGEVKLDLLTLLPENPDQPQPTVNREPIVKELTIGGAHVHLVLENISLEAKEDATASTATPLAWTLTHVSGYALIDLP